MLKYLHTCTFSPIEHPFPSYVLFRWGSRFGCLSPVWAVERFFQWMRFPLAGVEDSRIGSMQGNASNMQTSVTTTLTQETCLLRDPWAWLWSQRSTQNDFEDGSRCKLDSRDWGNESVSTFTVKCVRNKYTISCTLKESCSACIVFLINVQHYILLYIFQRCSVYDNKM